MKIGDLYHIEFWDHSIRIGKAIRSEAVGWVIENKEDANCPLGEAVTLTYWRTDSGDRDDDENNQEPLTILTNVIIRAKKLR